MSAVQVEPQETKMIQYSESSGEEEGSGVGASPTAKAGRGSVSSPAQSEETKAKVRFRYSRGTAGLLCGTLIQQNMMGTVIPE